MRPKWLEYIKKCDFHQELITEGLASTKSAVNRKLCELMIKNVRAEKAFYICICNRDKVGCQKWYDKIKKINRIFMEFIEDNKTFEDRMYLYYCNYAKEFYEKATQIIKII